MNCSIIAGDFLLIGCRDRRVFVYQRFTLELSRIIEVAESVHCMCTLHGDKQVAVGMTDGNVVVFDCSSDVSVIVERKFKEVGGIWSICSINNDSELAVGSLAGLFIFSIGQKDLKQT